MKTVGSILKDARLAKNLSYDQIEAATKIRAKFLEAIEEDDYTTLPSIAYAKGFVKNYGEFLGIPAGTILAFFRRQNKDISRSSILPKGLAPMNRTWFQLTPGRFLVFLLIGFVVVFLSYLGLQYRQIQNPPVLALSAPTEQATVRTKKIEVLGSTDPDATVTINGFSVFVRSDGTFFGQVSLEPGNNVITVITTSRFGKSTTVTRSVTYQTEEAR